MQQQPGGLDEGWGGRKLWHGWAIEVLSRSTMVRLVCSQKKRNMAAQVIRWYVLYSNGSRICTKKPAPHIVFFRTCKHLRPKLDYAHIPRELSRAWLILHQWESHHSNQVPAVGLGGWGERGDGEKQGARWTSHLLNLNSLLKCTKAPIWSVPIIQAK